jgi:hypothetical protein
MRLLHFVRNDRIETKDEIPDRARNDRNDKNEILRHSLLSFLQNDKTKPGMTEKGAISPSVFARSVATRQSQL